MSNEKMNRDVRECIYDILADEESKRVYDLIREARKYPQKEQYHCYQSAKAPGVDYYHFTMEDGYQVFGRNNMYFHNAFQQFSEEEVLLDAGAFNGDTVQEFHYATKGKYKKIYSLEPDKRNYNELKRRMKYFIDTGKLETFRAGLGGETVKAKFKSGGTCAHVSNSGDTEIKLFHAGEFIDALEYSPTVIKMDIEGQEYDALTAMADYLRNNKPMMSISIYHKQEDIWRIPKFVHEQMPKAKLYIRHNTNAFTETILYVCL